MWRRLTKFKTISPLANIVIDGYIIIIIYFRSEPARHRFNNARVYVAWLNLMNFDDQGSNHLRRIIFGSANYESSFDFPPAADIISEERQFSFPATYLKHYFIFPIKSRKMFSDAQSVRHLEKLKCGRISEGALSRCKNCFLSTL